MRLSEMYRILIEPQPYQQNWGYTKAGFRVILSFAKTQIRESSAA